MTTHFSQQLLPQLSRCISSRMGLEFSQKQWPNFEQRLRAAATELGYVDLNEFAEWLLAGSPGPTQVSVLASHLAIGESYFFRDPKTLDVLRSELLPSVIGRCRRTGCRRLKLWSAGCASGEEAYTLAIVLHELLPDISQWDITVLGTDFNMHALEIAQAGRYSDRAFRSNPISVRQQYFTRRDGQFEVVPEIKSMLQFSYLNLLDDLYPSVTNGTCDIDIIFCRNVLMYFSPECRVGIIERFYRSIQHGGWLIVSPSEVVHVPETHFTQIIFPHAFFFRKARQQEAGAAAVRQLADATQTAERSAQQQIRATFGTLHRQQLYENALKSFERGNYSEVEKILGVLDETTFSEKTCDLLARACLRQKKFDEALVWNEKTLSTDNFNARFHYVRAKILQEQRDFHEANASLRRSLYLDPHFVLAHFDMGRLARQQGRFKEAFKYFQNVLALLQHYAPNAILPESDGLQAQTLQNTVTAIIHAKVS